MGKVKYIVSFLVLLCCFILSGELYQNHVDTFNSNFYIFVAPLENVEEIQDKFSTIYEISREYGGEIFGWEREYNSSRYETVTLYVTQTSKKKLTDVYQIKPGVYKSLFSGTSEIVFKDISEFKKAEYHFIGSIESMVKIRSELDLSDCRITIQEAKSSKNDQWQIIAIWFVFGMLLLLLTWFDIKLQMKANFVLISLGKSNWQLVLRNAICDVLYLSGIYFILYMILRKYTYLGFYSNITITLFISVLALNSLLYLTILRYDLKKALSSSDFGNIVLSNCYVVKAVSLIVTIVVLSTNLILIADNAYLLLQKKEISEYDNCSFLQIKWTHDVKSETDEDLTKRSNYAKKVETGIVYEKFLEDEIYFSVHNYKNSLYISKQASNFLSGISEINHIDFSKDYYILASPTQANNQEEIQDRKKSFLYDFPMLNEKATYEVITYSGINIIPYFENTASDEIINFDYMVNPIIFICNFSEENLSIPEEDFSQCRFTDMMFKFTQEDKMYFEEKYNMKDYGLTISIADCAERNNYAWDSMLRIIILNTVVSIFMLILEFIMMTTTVRMEYTANAVEVSLKKVLGYSIFKRNRTVFLLNAFSVFIGVFTAAVASAMLRSEMLSIIITVGVTILFTEYIAICYYVNKLERTGVPKILKGGCL